jgi:hypothetical protein
MNCSYCGSVINYTDQKCKNCGASNDSYSPQVSSGVGTTTGPWQFESSVSGFGNRLVGSMGLNRAGSAPGFLEKMIRGAFLDGAIYRQAAADPNGTGSAFLAICIPVLARFAGSLLLAYRFQFAFRRIEVFVVSAVIGLLAEIAAIAVMAALSQAVTRRKMGFGEVLRGLAYAQSPGVLTIIPILGGLLSLWRIMTTIVAVREITGADLGKTIGLAAIGLVASILVSVILSPFLIASIGLSYL